MVFYYFNYLEANFQLVELYSWIPNVGIHYALGVDGISVWFLLLTTLLTLLVLVASVSVNKNIRGILRLCVAFRNRDAWNLSCP
jgi:NADH-quinone oxidoreductase subunit M